MIRFGKLSKIKELEKKALEKQRSRMMTLLIVDKEEDIEQYANKLTPGATVIIENTSYMREFLQKGG